MPAKPAEGQLVFVHGGVAPKRIQRQRTRGWRMSENAVYVGRPTWFGNPFTPELFWNAGYSGSSEVSIKACVKAYREWLTFSEFTLNWRSPEHLLGWLENTRQGRVERLGELRGKHLACWCPLGQPCHADVLLELANSQGAQPSDLPTVTVNGGCGVGDDAKEPK